MKLDLKYFQADEDDTFVVLELPFHLQQDSRYPNGKPICKFCGKSEGCLTLDLTTYSIERAKVVELAEGQDGNLYSGNFNTFGCIDCLRLGSFFYRHGTEAGELRENLFVKFDYDRQAYDPVDPQPSIDEIAKLELRKTPSFRTFQGDVWLVHCDDFMTYIGVWDFEDFKKNDPNGNVLNFFIQTAGKNAAYDWNVNSETGLHELFHGEYANACCYAFHCTKCGIHRVYLDNG
ncbi:CbrC family protein [Leptospira santarosai]|uniref:CbrC family protein n=1 Tax=Leptospira santarosai TaxID=28183 RepID=UPI0024AED8FD|nr:CbrC family protein [Leptospira santarosai]MDI7227741.1 CbrC family protein [Leptospira santarosai]